MQRRGGNSNAERKQWIKQQTNNNSHNAADCAFCCDRSFEEVLSRGLQYVRLWCRRTYDQSPERSQCVHEVGKRGEVEKGSGDAGERWGYCAALGCHADQPRDITGGGVCMRAHVCVCSWGVMNADSWACRFNSLLYMLERTHTIQNAGSTVAVIAIVHAVCVSASVCAHAACTFKSVCACVWKLHTSTQEKYTINGSIFFI